LIFDYPEIDIDAEALTQLMTTHDVFITSRQKSRQSTMCIVIKGIEKYISNIYDARHELLKLSCERIVAEIPPPYYGPNDLLQFKSNSIAQLLAGPTTFSPMSPNRNIQHLQWNNSASATPELQSWRSRVAPHSPLTTNMVHKHNMNHGNLQVPSISYGRHNGGHNAPELQTSGYHSFSTDTSLMKNGHSAGNSSLQSSPENSMNNGTKYIGNGQHVNNMSTFMDSPPNQVRAMNDSLLYSYDPRIVQGKLLLNSFTTSTNSTFSFS